VSDERNYVIYSTNTLPEDPPIVFVHSYKRARDGCGMDGGYTTELKKAKKWSSRKQAERMAEELYRCHVTTLRKAQAMIAPKEPVAGQEK